MNSSHLVMSLHQLAEDLGRTVKLMEVCGTHTMAIFRNGIRSILPKNIQLISGPGCPVCVTPIHYIDTAYQLTEIPNLTICSYGDMLRVPGTSGSLLDRRAQGYSVRLVYSARDALLYAQDHPEQEVVFLAVGFETTAPATAIVVQQARQLKIRNFSVLTAHKLVVPALKALLSDPSCQIQGFLLPGHVSAIIGQCAYQSIAHDFHIPGVIAGFEPEQILAGLVRLLQLFKDQEAKIVSIYHPIVQEEGNLIAQKLLREVFEPVPTEWRGLGTIPESGLQLRPEFQEMDAWKRYAISVRPSTQEKGCRCGDVIQGKLLPPECPMFGKQCLPQKPLGPCMVSSEGTCAAYYKYTPKLTTKL